MKVWRLNALDKYNIILNECVQKGYKEYLTYPSDDKLIYQPYTVACIVNDLIKKNLNKELATDRDWKFRTENQLLILTYKNKYCIRINMVSDKFKLIGRSSKRRLNYIDQDSLFFREIVDESCNIILGYKIDKLRQKISAYLILPKSSNNPGEIKSISTMNSYNSNQVPEVLTKTTPRVKIKQSETKKVVNYGANN